MARFSKRFFLKGFGFAFLLLPLSFNGFAKYNDLLRIDSVSVNPANGYVQIGWTLQTSITEGYIEINRQLYDDTYGLIYTIPGLGVSFFEDNGSNANLGSFSYYITAFESNGGTIAPSFAHRTIFLEQPMADFCNNEIILSWSNYQVTTTSGIPQQQPVPFDSLRVQYSTDGQNFNTLATFLQQPISVDLQQYTIIGLEPGQHYFRIQSFNSASGVTSTSNIRSFGYNPPQITDLQIETIDIFENQEVRVSFSAQGQTNEFTYDIYRSALPDQGFENVGSSPLPATLADFPDISTGPWYYQVKAFLSDWECELPSYENLEVFSSVFLETSYLLNGAQPELYFEWSHFFPENKDFIYQLKWQSVNDVWHDFPAFYDDGSFSFIYPLSPGQFPGITIFKMEAWQALNPVEVVSSNYTLVELEELVRVPNAFRPSSNDARNMIFKPLFVGFDPDQYQLNIFNHWGQVIFSSNEPDTGWDGRMNGKFAEPGVYSYLLQYRGPSGKTVEKRGVVTLVF